MLFNSIEYLVFLPVVFCLYWFVFQKNLRLQNLFLLAVSYFFYGWWDWRFLGLIVLSSFVDYFVGLELFKSDSQKRRKIMLGISLGVNLGILGFFKYFNFFLESLILSLESLGIQANASSLQIMLPVGISFYTFQTLSYSIDIYRRKIEPVKDIVGFFSFVSFFPQLVAGPIERAAHLLPQFSRTRKFDIQQASDGLRQILWGLFKKVVIADNLAFHVDYIFSNYESLGASTLALGAIFFAFQIYGDFSGYSDIAIGTARLFGFDLMKNFATPYFSRDIGEFWRRWHISLSTWFRDYVYIPLGGSRTSKGRQILNSLITFTVSGFWHGANWTFIVWGFLNGLYYVPSILLGREKKRGVVAQGAWLPGIKEFLQMLTTFSLVTLSWIFFRAKDLSHAWDYLIHLASPTILEIPQSNRSPIPYIISLVLIEWIQRKKEHGLDIGNYSQLLRTGVYILVFLVILLFGFDDSESFIYFQF